MRESASFLFKRLKYINKPFKNLPLKQRAIFILHLAGFTYREIQKLKIVASPETISKAIINGYKEYKG